MKYYKYLYVSDSIRHTDKLKVKLSKHMGCPDIYVIFWARNNDQLEIMNASFLKLHFYRKKPPVIVGLAKSYDEAVDLIINMTNEALEHTGKPDIKDYLILRAKTRNFTKTD